MQGHHISSTETQQRHSLYSKGGNGQLSQLPIGEGISLIVQYLSNDQLRMMMPSLLSITLGKGGTHLSRGIGGV